MSAPVRLLTNLLTLVIWMVLPTLQRFLSLYFFGDPGTWADAYIRSAYSLLVTYLVIAPMLCTWGAYLERRRS